MKGRVSVAHSGMSSLLLCFAPCFPCGCQRCSGRDNFLASEADKALIALWGAVSEARALQALLASTSHKGPHVRCRAAAHLDEVACGGQGLEGLVRGSWPLLDKVFK